MRLPGNGWRLCQTQAARRFDGHRPLACPDRQALRHRRRFRNPAPSGGASGPLQGLGDDAAWQRIGKINRKRRGFSPHRPHSTCYTPSRKVMTALAWFRNRLFCARMNGFGVRTGYSGSEADQKTVSEAVFPPNGENCQRRSRRSSRPKSGDSIARQGFAWQTTRGFAFLDDYCGGFSKARACHVMGERIVVFGGGSIHCPSSVCIANRERGRVGR